MKFAVCDDMDIYLKKIKEKINLFCSGTIEIDEYFSGEELLEHFEKGKYDAVILDYQMKELNGLETAEKVHSIDENTVIALHTGYGYLDSHGYDIGSYVYMSKNQPDYVYQSQLNDIMEECRFRNLVFECSAGNFPVKNIIRFKQKFRTLIMYTTTGEYGLEISIEDINIPKFARVNKRCIINSRFIEHNKADVLTLTDGSKITVSRTYFDKLRKALMS